MISIETLAKFWRCAEPILTQGANTNLANQTLPTSVTNANIRCDASSVDTNWIADRLCTVYASPTRLALATLAIVRVVSQKRLQEVIVTPSVIDNHRL